jgi:NADH dehydrogenase
MASFKATLKNKQLVPFKYNDKGSMAIIIGKNEAVDRLTKMMHFKGFIAWAIWLFIHLVSLITYRNGYKRFYWMISYFLQR